MSRSEHRIYRLEALEGRILMSASPVGALGSAGDLELSPGAAGAALSASAVEEFLKTGELADSTPAAEGPGGYEDLGFFPVELASIFDGCDGGNLDGNPEGAVPAGASEAACAELGGEAGLVLAGADADTDRLTDSGGTGGSPQEVGQRWAPALPGLILADPGRLHSAA